MDQPQIPSLFNGSDPRADLVIHTSDGCHLFIREEFLLYCSHYFFHRFCESGKPPDGEHKYNPLYNVPEDARTMSAVLRLCYPIADASWDVIGEVLAVPVLSTLQKYGMEDAETRLRGIVEGSPQMLKKEPLKMFAIARQLGLEDVAKAAARYFVATGIHGDWKGMKMVTALDYHILLDYFHRCSSAVSDFLETAESESSIMLNDGGFSPSVRGILSNTPVDCPVCNAPQTFMIVTPFHALYAHPWINEVLRKAREQPGMDLVDEELINYAMEAAVGKCVTQSYVGVRDLLKKLQASEVDRILSKIDIDVECEERTAKETS